MNYKVRLEEKTVQGME